MTLIFLSFFSDHFRGFTVKIGNDTSTKRLCHKHETNLKVNRVMSIDCEAPIVGKVVVIQVAENVDKLVLCEVEIFGGTVFTPFD